MTRRMVHSSGADEHDETDRCKHDGCYPILPPRSLHHRLYPHMDELVQYATEGDDPEVRPWIVRDRSTALRNERQGRGKALVRVWVASDWEYVEVPPRTVADAD